MGFSQLTQLVNRCDLAGAFAVAPFHLQGFAVQRQAGFAVHQLIRGFAEGNGRAGKADLILIERGDQHPAFFRINYKEIIQNEKVAKVSIVGAGMVTTPGVTYRMFRALSEENINILAISTSEIKLSVIIDEENTLKAIKIKLWDLPNH